MIFIELQKQKIATIVKTGWSTASKARRTRRLVEG